MLTAAGFPVPTTGRDLSELYLAWGLAHREETPDGTRWSMPAALPLPGDLLPRVAELTKRLDWIRWTMRTVPLVDRLIKYLLDELGEPQQVLTSLDRLAAATGCDADDVRIALAEHVEAGDAQVQRGLKPAEAERLEAHQRFRLVMNWDHFHETRMRLSFEPRRVTETGLPCGPRQQRLREPSADRAIGRGKARSPLRPQVARSRFPFHSRGGNQTRNASRRCDADLLRRWWSADSQGFASVACRCLALALANVSSAQRAGAVGWQCVLAKTSPATIADNTAHGAVHHVLPVDPKPHLCSKSRAWGKHSDLKPIEHRSTVQPVSVGTAHIAARVTTPRNHPSPVRTSHNAGNAELRDHGVRRTLSGAHRSLRRTLGDHQQPTKTAAGTTRKLDVRPPQRGAACSRSARWDSSMGDLVDVGWRHSLLGQDVDHTPQIAQRAVAGTVVQLLGLDTESQPTILNDRDCTVACQLDTADDHGAPFFRIADTPDVCHARVRPGPTADGSASPPTIIRRPVTLSRSAPSWNSDTKPPDWLPDLPTHCVSVRTLPRAGAGGQRPDQRPQVVVHASKSDCRTVSFPC